MRHDWAKNFTSHSSMGDLNLGLGVGEFFDDYRTHTVHT